MAHQPPDAGVPVVRVPDARLAEAVVPRHERLVALQARPHAAHPMIAVPVPQPLGTVAAAIRLDARSVKVIADLRAANRSTRSRQVPVGPDVRTPDAQLLESRPPEGPGAVDRREMAHEHPAIVRGREPVDPVLVLAATVPVLAADQERIVPVWAASGRVCHAPVADDRRVATVGSGPNRRPTPNGGQPKFERHAGRVAPR